MASCHKRRVALLKNELAKRKLDSFLVTDRANVSYLSGFTGHDSMLLITRGRDYLVTDSRYIEDARISVKGFDIRLVEYSTFETLSQLAKKLRLKRIGFESMELPFGVVKKLMAAVRPSKLSGEKGLVEILRAVKDASEVELIKDSIRLTRAVFDSITGMIRPGVSEKTIAKRCEIAFIESGAKASFEPIIAAGANASKPHAVPTDQPLRKDSFVMIDMGCALNGYCSDMTRMVMLGRVKEKFKKIYYIVRAAQGFAINKIKPGVRARDIDLAARGCIERHGFGKYFGHAVGHGVGMMIHELPSISRSSDVRLESGMVFTVEPAIYIPKFGGVRIEDMVLVTDKGCEVLTR